MAIPNLLAKRADAIGDDPFLYFRDRTITFGEMEARSDRAAVFLREMGVDKGDRVCLLLANRPEFIELWFGLAKLGAVMVPLSTTLKADGFSYIINHSESTIIVVDSIFFPVFKAIEHKLEKVATKIWIGSESGIPPFFTRYPDTSATGSVTRSSRVSGSDVMSIVYTSTGAGLPRGTMIPHHNYTNTGKTWADSVIQACSSEIFFTNLPLYQINAQITCVMGALSSGRPLVLGERFHASRFIDEVRQYGATVFNLVGWMFSALMKEPTRPDDAQNPARIVFGAATPMNLWQGFEERYGVTILEGYGRAESGGLCLANNRKDRKVGSIGKPMPFCDVKIVDENDRELPAGMPGEIVVRPVIPDTIFAGYYNNPDLTRETMRNGWFHSGDCGYVDEENFFYYLDRTRDCIRIEGKIVPSPEIENIINSHPGVLESAVVGVPCGPGQEDIRAFVVPRDSVLISAEEILAWCNGRMANYMRPRFVSFLGELPKTMTQRIMKDRLRAQSLEGCWDREETAGLGTFT
jgi:crotonobetaine/carnitine-CoA ligase